jgi:predicted PurR-regulated permease PerM
MEQLMRQAVRDQPEPALPTAPVRPRALGRQALIVAGVALALVAIFLFARAAIDVLLLIFAGVLLAILLRAIAEPLAAHTPIGPRAALAVVVLLLIGGLVLGGRAFAPALADQIDQLGQEIPATLRQAQNWLAQYGWGQWLINQFQNPNRLPQPSELIGNVGGLFSNTVGVLVSLLVFLFLGLYLAIEPRLYIHGLIALLPPARRERGRVVLATLHETLRWWLISKLIAMVVIGVLTTFGLWLLGVPLALALGIIAALLSFIPNLGPTLATIPALLLALNGGPVLVAQVLALYLAIQALESYVLTPYIERKTVALPPALTLASQVALGVLIGSLGVFLAAPLVAVAIVLARMLYIEDVLGDHQTASDDAS